MLTWVWFSLVTVLGHAMAKEGGGGFFPVPVWKLMNVSGGADALDSGRPRFSCGDSWLSVRFKLVRHSNLSLEDGKRLSSLPDKCGASSQTFGSWLLLKFPYPGCPVESWVSNGTSVHQLRLRYVDHLLQDRVTAVASCRDPAPWRQTAVPLVRCTASDVTVKLPLGGSLQRVEALGGDGVVGTAISTTTAEDALSVQISRRPDTDSFLEVTLLDSAGETLTVVSACLNGTAEPGDSRPRSPKHSQISDLDDEASLFSDEEDEDNVEEEDDDDDDAAADYDEDYETDDDEESDDDDDIASETDEDDDYDTVAWDSEVDEDDAAESGVDDDEDDDEMAGDDAGASDSEAASDVAAGPLGSTASGAEASGSEAADDH